MGGLFSFGLRSGCDEGLTARRKTPARLFPPAVQQILQGDLPHLFSHGSEDLIIGLLEHRANPAPHRTLGGGIGVYAQKLMFFVRFQGRIHIPHRDLLRTAEQDCAAGSPGHRQNPCLLQGAEQIADHHRIAAGAGCQSGAGHPPPVKYRNADQTVQRNGTFGTDAHGVSPLITRYHLIGNL